MLAPDRIYYEFMAGEYYLCVAGNIQTFGSKQALEAYVSQVYPDSQLVEVDDDNWDDLYDSGAFQV